MKNLRSYWKLLVVSGALGLGACASSDKDSGDEATDGDTSEGTDDGTTADGETGDDGTGGTGGGDGTGDDDGFIPEDGPPIDMTPYFEEIEARCAGVFTGEGQEHVDPGAIACRYDGVGYASEIQLDGEWACTINDGQEEADCTNATEATIELVGELVAEADTYVVTGSAWIRSEDVDSVLLQCGYRVEDRDPDELPNLEETGGEIDLGVTFAQWRYDEDGAEWEYCVFVLEEHTPPG